MLLTARPSYIPESVLGFLLTSVFPSRGADEESSLLGKMARADRTALKALYDRLAPQAFGVAMRVLSSRSEAEDTIQDSFLDVWARCGQYDPMRGSGRAWVLAIVRNRAIDRLRSRAASARMVDRAENESVHSAQPAGPLEVAEQSEARVQIQSALSELSADQRRALELAYFEGLSQSEIAEHLDEPLGTVKTRIRAAMEKLSRILPATRSRS